MAMAAILLPPSVTELSVDRVSCRSQGKRSRIANEVVFTDLLGSGHKGKEAHCSALAL